MSDERLDSSFQIMISQNFSLQQFHFAIDINMSSDDVCTTQTMVLMDRAVKQCQLMLCISTDVSYLIFRY